MNAYWGIWTLGSTIKIPFQGKGSNDAATAATGSVSYRVYGDSATPLVTGTASAFDTGNLTGSYLASFEGSLANGFASGQVYRITFLATVSGVAKQEDHGFQIA